MFKLKQKTSAADNFMLYIPIINHSNWIEKQNNIYLIFEHDKPMERFAAWLVRKPTTTDLKLDDLGTKVWKLMNGSNSVYSIGQILLRDYGPDFEPVYERLVVYLRYLCKMGWIKFKAQE